MSRRMSCSLRTDAVRERRKTVTRRREDTWTTLRPGDRLTLVEKAMGLPKGARQVVLAEVEVVSVRVEALGLMTYDELRAEGFAYSVADFIAKWLDSHGYSAGLYRACPEVADDVHVRRIEWRYL